MDEKEVLAQSADELTKVGDIEEVQVVLRREGRESFPVLLFMANALKDLLDIATDLISLTVIGYIGYFLFLWLPLMVANFWYLWGKIGFYRKMGLKILGGFALRLAVRALVLMGVMSLIPFANLLFPQCLLVLAAHNRHNKFVSELLVAADLIGQASRGRVGAAMALRRGAEAYAENAAIRAIEQAKVSGRIGERFGEDAEKIARRLEKKYGDEIVRVARKKGGRALTRGAIAAIRASQPPRPPRAGGEGGGRSAA